MRAYVIFGSPNPDGHTATAVDKLLAELKIKDAEKFSCYDSYIAPCTDCKGCKTGEKCAVEDDFGKLEREARRADLLIFAYPLYFDGVPAPMKAVIDRMQPFYMAEKVTGRLPVGTAKAVAIVTMGGDGPKCPVPDGILTFVSRAFGASYIGHAAVKHTDTKPDYSELNELIGGLI